MSSIEFDTFPVIGIMHFDSILTNPWPPPFFLADLKFQWNLHMAWCGSLFLVSGGVHGAIPGISYGHYSRGCLSPEEGMAILRQHQRHYKWWYYT